MGVGTGTAGTDPVTAFFLYGDVVSSSRLFRFYFWGKTDDPVGSAAFNGIRESLEFVWATC